MTCCEKVEEVAREEISCDEEGPNGPGKGVKGRFHLAFRNSKRGFCLFHTLVLFRKQIADLLR
jgi:hypothetical protein